MSNINLYNPANWDFFALRITASEALAPHSGRSGLRPHSILARFLMLPRLKNRANPAFAGTSSVAYSRTFRDMLDYLNNKINKL